MEKAVLAAVNNDDLQVQKMKEVPTDPWMKVLYSCWSICLCAGTF